MACTKNDSTELAITSTIGESEWEGSMGCYHDVITLRTKLWHRQWSKQLSIELGGNSVRTSKSGSTGTENPLNWVVVLFTTVQIVLFDYHGSWIFEDKYDEICLAGPHGNELNLPPEIRQDQAPTFVFSSFSARPRADKSQFISLQKCRIFSDISKQAESCRRTQP